MSTDVEVAVVGGGVMGACTAWRVARRGHDVHLFEQFERGHAHGSSHGSARIFRLAYPDAEYVAMARAGLPLWDELEEVTGARLRTRVGELDHGDPAEVATITANLADAGLDHEVLSPADVAARWPGLRADRAAVFHPDGGTVDATATVLAALDAATQLGAIVHERCPVQRIEPLSGSIGRSDAGVVLHTADGSVTARRVVVTAGAWVGTVLGDLLGSADGAGPVLPAMVVTREQPVHYTRVAVEGAGVDGQAPWPSFIHWSDAGPEKTSGVDELVWGYGMQTPDGRIKMGEHHTGEVVARIEPGQSSATPPVDEVEPVDLERLERLREYARTWLPGVDPESAEPERCLYTSTATTDFVLDRVGPLVIAAGFSGHGFKFAPRIGDVVAAMVDGASSPARRFTLRR